MVSHYYKNDEIQLFHNDCLEILQQLPDNSIDMIFADPPYFLSNGGISCRAGKVVSVNKAEWDKSRGFEEDLKFTLKWISECKRILKDNGTIWISGTMHNIYQVGYSLQLSNYKILNEISWFKPNAPPNLSCKYFAHAHETILWARKSENKSHYFNYEEMRKWEDKITPSGKQMRSVWSIPLTPQREKIHGKHPTQKPLELLRRIILSSTKEGAVILDPFMGSGTTGVIAKELNRKFIGIDKEIEYLELALKRMNLTTEIQNSIIEIESKKEEVKII
ncbi:MAG: DNA-methyltransferase [Candidatus Woesearchaeota archaeon]